MNRRIYKVDTMNDSVCYFDPAEPHWCMYQTHRTGATTNTPENPRFRDATPTQIAEFEAKESELAERRRLEHERESALLALCNLTHGDFCRFRSVHIEGNVLHVSTRENGVNDISVGAIRNPSFKSRENDDGDSTYAHYEFALPTIEVAP